MRFYLASILLLSLSVMILSLDFTAKLVSVSYLLLVLSEIFLRSFSHREDRSLKLGMITLGASIPVAAFFDPDLLLVQFVVFCTGIILTSPLRRFPVFFPFLSVVLISTLALWLRDFNLDFFSFLLDLNASTLHSRFEGLLRYLDLSPPLYWRATENFLRYLSIVLLFLHLNARRDETVFFFTGFLPSLFISALGLILQFFDLLPISVENQTQFWTAQGRFSGFLTDPNAAGILFGLAIPLLLFVKERIPAFSQAAVYALLSLSFVAGLLTGSRSFILSVLLFMLILLFISSWKRLAVFVSFIGLSVLLWNLLLWVNITSMGTLSLLPVSLKRLIYSLSYPTVSEALYSRSLFSSMVARMWSDNPILGIGIGRFRELMPLYYSNFGEGALYTDNPNSFYLGLLVETGLLGLTAFFFSFTFFKVSKSNLHGRSAFLVLALLLLTGPHTDFNEVAILAAVILAHGLELKEKSPGLSFESLPDSAVKIPFYCCLLLGLSFHFPKVLNTASGYYSFEIDGGRLFRWTTNRASNHVECNSTGEASVEIRTLSAPASAAASYTLGLEEEARLIDIVELEAAGRRYLVSCPFLASSVGYSIEVSNPWIPWKAFPVADSRLLGVQDFSVPVRK